MNSEDVSAYNWLWGILSHELGTERAEAIRIEYEARGRRTRLQAEADRARRELVELEKKLDALKRENPSTSRIKQLQDMIAKRKRILAADDETNGQ